MTPDFLECLAPGETDRHCFQAFHDRKEAGSPPSPILHGSFTQHQAMLDAYSAAGYGVFWTVNRTDGRGRSKENITGVRCLWLDIDEAGRDLAPIVAALQPHCVVESSPGKHHLYWRVGDCGIAEFDGLLDQLTERWHGDHGAKGINRVLRLPGFAHQKGTAFAPRIVSWVLPSARPYTVAEVRATLLAGVVAAPPRAADRLDSLNDGPRADWSGPTSDEELLRRAMQSRSSASKFGGGGPSFADLWHCETGVLAAAYPDPDRPFNASRADAALAQMLAFWCGCDHERIDRLIRQSGLVREKYDRDDYLHRTIAKACAQQVDVLQDKPKPPRDAGVGVTELRYGMTPDDPYNTARALIQRRFAHADGARLKAWQDTLYRWQSAHWLEMANGDVRAEVYDFLDREGESHYRPTQSKVSNLIDALRAAAHLSSESLPPCWISGDALAPAGELVACANGLLHLRTRSMLPATPRFFNLNAVPFNYEATAPPPAQWLQFLRDVWPNDSEAIDTLQEVFGYLLTPDTSQQKIFLVIGPKRSGKGTIARVLTEMLGIANVAGPSLASLAKEFGLQPLIGKQAAIIADARLGGHVDAKQVAENLLRISGEDRVDVARKNTSSLSLRLGVRFVLLTNELPRIGDASGAMASRFVILTMTESFIGREDPGLTSKLLGELPGVLSWAVEGWHRLNARGHFIEPKSSAGAAQELADLGSPIAAFVRDECACGPHSTVETGALFTAWRVWCAKQGMQSTGTLQTFGRDLRAAFPSITTSQARSEGDRIRLYRGISLRGTQWHAGQAIATHAAGMAQQFMESR